MSGATCNICGSTAFGDTFGKAGSAFIRKSVRCEGCGSLERHRLIFEVLRSRGLLSGNRRILHLAPEECLATILRSRFGQNYLCGDLDPGQFSFPVRRIDLCEDLESFSPLPSISSCTTMSSNTSPATTGRWLPTCTAC